MTAAIPLELVQLRDRLLQDFSEHLPPATTGDATAKERNFLSRALTALAVQELHSCSIEDASKAVVDGGGDGGIDAVHYSSATSRLLLVQSKYVANGRKQPDLGDVSKFKDGVEALLRGNFDWFADNAVMQERLPQIRVALNDAATQVRAVLVYSGISVVSEDRIRLFEYLRTQFLYPTDYFAFQRFNLTSIHDWLISPPESAAIDNVVIELHQPSRVAEPHETWIGLIKLKDLASLYETHGKRLVAANIRNYKGSTSVNASILEAARDEPEQFFYLNNGLTAYCDRIDCRPIDRPNRERATLTAYGFSIVNGAQTAGSVAKAISETSESPPDGYALLKIISLAQCEDSREFAIRITRSTNYQNQVDARDFAALDPEQERIRAHLELSGVTYHFKDGDDPSPSDDANFTLIEAAVALACLEPLDPDKGLDAAPRVLRDRKSLWSQDAFDTGAVEATSWYRRLFRPDRTALTIWRAVQIMRVVKGRMQENGRSESGKRKQFFENARWMVLHVIFLQLRPEDSSDLTLSAVEISSIRLEVDRVAEAFWTFAETLGQTRHFKTIFCDPADCRRLKDSVMAQQAGAAGNARPESIEGTE